MGAELDVSVREHGQVQVVHPRGALTARTEGELRRVLAGVLTDHGRVVVDLDGFRLGRPSCVAVFPAVLDQCGGWPAARLALCRPDHAMAQALEQRRVSALVPVYPMLLEAEAAIERRPAVVRARARLACDDQALDVARQLVREVSPGWDVDAELQQIAELVVSELVDNAVRHARTAAALTLERGHRGLRIAVRDTASAEGFGPLPLYPVEGRRVGRGLELVARLTTAWGVEPHPVGKTVWAEIARPLAAGEAAEAFRPRAAPLPVPPGPSW